jgi:hypothetical protein
MSEQNGVETFYFFPKHLVTEIRCGIHNEPGVFRLYHNAAAKPLVFFIGRRANSAFAGDHGHAAAGTGAEKCYFDGRDHDQTVNWFYLFISNRTLNVQDT